MKTNSDRESVQGLKYSKEINIATAGTRLAKKWKNQTITIQKFVEHLSQTVRTPETVLEYRAMPKVEQDNVKDVGAFVGGSLKGGRRRKADVANRHIITLDLDYATRETIPIIKDALSDTCFTIYSTHKHTTKNPRLRLILYPDRAMLPDEYQAIARKMAAKIDMEAFDDSSYDTNRLFYWPSTSSDGNFVSYHHDKAFLAVDEILKEYGEEDAWKDVTLWPRSSRETKTLGRMLAKQADPLTKKGLIGAFCRVVPLKTTLSEYLGDIYKQESKDRYTYIEGSSSNGLVIYNDRFTYSNHDSDPASGQLCNSFDLIRIHKFGHLDEDMDYGTPTTKLPSYKEMIEWARDVEGVKVDLVKSGLEIDASAFDTFDADSSGLEEWEAKLQTTETGTIKPTFFNAVLIIKHDLEVSERMRFNEFSLLNERPGDKENWTEEDSYQVRIFVGNKYGVDFPEQKIEQAIENNAKRHKYHPVRDYLTALEWDGEERIETIFIDYFGCSDNIYVREVALCWFSAAVCRVMEPGYKFDTALVISGAQGIGKTRFIYTLGHGRWYGELSSFDPKIAMEEISGKWIIEINEMGATNKQELEAQKSFLSACSTRVRMAYARHARDFKRQCVFFGSTNQIEYLKDSTGNRRWWPLDAKVKTVDIDKLQENLDQIWAEAFSLWAQGKSVFLSPEAEIIAREIQVEKREDDEWEGIIEEWLEHKAYSDRYDSKKGTIEMEFDGELAFRERVCIAEIWEDCLEINNRPPRPVERRRIGGIMDRNESWERVSTVRFGRRFGRQKGWIRGVPF